LLTLVERVVPSDVSLLILGETGVGKEHLARAIHTAGPRAAQPFIPVNCGAIPENLLESELFGHEAGAFTGAIRQRRGMFSLADKGTLFLDEIGEMPYHLQVKLLRALQSREIMPVGGEKVQRVDVRVMAASNRDLELEVKEGRFRQDLYYRLSVLPLTIPPLRERIEDIPLFTRRFLKEFGTANGRHMASIDGEVMDAFARYPWPGNIRELMNVVERAVLVSRGSSLTAVDLPVEFDAGMSDLAVDTPEVELSAAGPPAVDAGPEGGIMAPVELTAAGTADSNGMEQPATPAAEALPAGAMPVDRRLVSRPLRDVRQDAVENVERRYLHALLRITGGRVGETARRAGIVPRSLYDKMKKYGLRKEDYR
jgi:transcriptional regulator with GAF, ATPase, and Fis domain